MIALLLALSLNPAAGPAATPPPAAPAPAAVDQPEATPQATQEQVAQLQALFDQSCAQRAYATYDDLCDALKTQVQIAQRAADRARRAHPTVTVTTVTNP